MELEEIIRALEHENALKNSQKERPGTTVAALQKQVAELEADNNNLMVQLRKSKENRAAKVEREHLLKISELEQYVEELQMENMNYSEITRELEKATLATAVTKLTRTYEDLQDNFKELAQIRK